ncbi:SpoIIAA-like [Alteromonadaceae bacterium Bs31]|nr:SpoIIAA-like [Alteromonadaceae bacterium Bs31]
MLKVTKIGDSRLNIEFEGSLNAQEMEDALEDFISKAAGIDNGIMLYEINDFEFPSLAALGVKFSKLPTLFGFIGKFKKAAMLTDKKWLQKVSEIEGMLIPGLQIKAFSSEERAAAEEWLTS